MEEIEKFLKFEDFFNNKRVIVTRQVSSHKKTYTTKKNTIIRVHMNLFWNSNENFKTKHSLQHLKVKIDSKAHYQARPLGLQEEFWNVTSFTQHLGEFSW